MVFPRKLQKQYSIYGYIMIYYFGKFTQTLKILVETNLPTHIWQGRHDNLAEGIG